MCCVVRCWLGERVVCVSLCGVLFRVVCVCVVLCCGDPLRVLICVCVCDCGCVGVGVGDCVCGGCVL